MRCPLSRLVLLALPLALIACDAAGPESGSPASQSADDTDRPTADVRCGGEDAVARRAAAEVLRRDDGSLALTLDLAIAQHGDAAHGVCETHVLVPLRTDVLRPGDYEVGLADRNVLVYRREADADTDGRRFAPLTGRLRIDHVGDDGVGGFLAVRAVTDRGTAAATAHFRASLGR